MILLNRALNQKGCLGTQLEFSIRTCNRAMACGHCEPIAMQKLALGMEQHILTLPI